MTNPEQQVLDAIAGLEADEIGERVRWQLEEGMARGEHLPPGRVRNYPAPPLTPGPDGPYFGAVFQWPEFDLPAPGEPFDMTALDAEMRRLGFGEESR